MPVDAARHFGSGRQLPSILSAAGDAVKTNFPASRLSEMLDLAGQVDQGAISRVVLGPEYSDRSSDPSTYMLLPDMAKWAAMSVKLFGADSRYWVPPASPAPSATP